MGIKQDLKMLCHELCVRWKEYCRRRHLAPNTKALYENNQISVGEHTYGEPHILSTGFENKLVIGKFCSIADNVRIMLGGEHHSEFVSTYPFYHGLYSMKNWNQGDIPDLAWRDRVSGDVRIGNDVWIGRDVLLMPGVTIGDGAIIGARTVVTKDVPPYAIVVGAPMRVIRYRFSESQIEDLLKIKWWDWDDERVQAELPYIMSADIDAFIARHKHKVS